MNISVPGAIPAVTTNRFTMTATNPYHVGYGKNGIEVRTFNGAGLADMLEETDADKLMRTDGFAGAMLRALDAVSAQQLEPSNLMQQAVLDPGSVDVHDITIAQAKANMSLNITRTILSRVVQGWKDIINTR